MIHGLELPFCGRSLSPFEKKIRADRNRHKNAAWNIFFQNLDSMPPLLKVILKESPGHPAPGWAWGQMAPTGFPPEARPQYVKKAKFGGPE